MEAKTSAVPEAAISSGTSRGSKRKTPEGDADDALVALLGPWGSDPPKQGTQTPDSDWAIPTTHTAKCWQHCRLSRTRSDVVACIRCWKWFKYHGTPSTLNKHVEKCEGCLKAEGNPGQALPAMAIPAVASAKRRNAGSRQARGADAAAGVGGDDGGSVSITLPGGAAAPLLAMPVSSFAENQTFVTNLSKELVKDMMPLLMKEMMPRIMEALQQQQKSPSNSK